MDNQFAIGHAQIDQEHTKLFEVLDELLAHPFITHDELARLVSHLKQYVLFHFRSEEGLMRAAGWPKADGHIAMHRLLEDTVELMDQSLTPETDPQDYRKRLHAFLLEWLCIHILEHDAMFSRYVAEQASA